MKIEYDEEVDGLYIWLVNDIERDKDKYSSEIWPTELKDEIGLLFDAEGKLMGFEIQPASKYLPKEFFKKK